FDTYLVDEVTAVGDASFRRKSRSVFADRMRHSSAILVNHSMGQLRQFCNAGLVLDAGQLQYFDDLEEAIEVHQAMME
ncbi:MAG: ABC transporter ATP-binding protein, partial [Pseudomonadota bacterium]|nr:ABC transporter ATP-binding protein [Pseudomonadota bacterium]